MLAHISEDEGRLFVPSPGKRQNLAFNAALQPPILPLSYLSVTYRPVPCATLPNLVGIGGFWLSQPKLDLVKVKMGRLV